MLGSGPLYPATGPVTVKPIARWKPADRTFTGAVIAVTRLRPFARAMRKNSS